MSTNYSHFSNSDMSYQDFENEKKGSPNPHGNHNQQFKNLFDDEYMSSIGVHAPATDWGNSNWEMSNGRNPYSDHYKKNLRWEETMGNFFFSKENIKYLHRRIIEEVKRIKGVDISEQSTEKVLLIMQNVYEYAMSGSLPNPSHPNSIGKRGGVNIPLKDRLSRLNQSVIQQCVREIISSIDQYLLYYKDASTLPLPLERPINKSSKGSRSLEYNIAFKNNNIFKGSYQ